MTAPRDQSEADAFESCRGSADSPQGESAPGAAGDQPSGEEAGGREAARDAGAGGEAVQDDGGGGQVILSAEEVAALQRQSEERDLYLNELRRAKADLDNYQKRMRKDRELWEERAEARLLRKLLGVLDDFDRALGAMDQEGANLALLLDGVRMTHQTFRNVLSNEGVEEIQALGQPFNPEFHEAVMEEPVSDRPTGEVLDVLQRGYRLRETVLRPSKVKVARNVGSE